MLWLRLLSENETAVSMASKSSWQRVPITHLRIPSELICFHANAIIILHTHKKIDKTIP